MPERIVSLLPLEGAPLGLALPVDDSASGDPFVRVGRQVLWSRRLRAVVVSSSGAIVETCVLHLPSEDLGDSTGADLDRRFAALRTMLSRVRAGGAEGYFPEIVLPGDDGEGFLPPLVYCPVPGTFFELPCPRCFEPLETCRDDAFLAKYDLPLYSTSSRRVLVCPKCSARLKRPPVVDPRPTSSLTPSGALVLSARDYLGALSGALAAEEPPEVPDGFRCGGCPEREQCWSWPEKEGADFNMRGLEVAATASQGPRWRAFTNHTVPFVLTRPAMIPLESFVRQVASEAQRAGETEENQVRTNLLFAFDGSGIDVAEILTLRLTAFRQAVHAVREHHRLFASPHLDISSESLVVAAGDTCPELPSLWQFRVRLEPTSAVDSLNLGGAIEVAIPPQDPVAPFFSQRVRDFLLTGSRVGELRVQRMTPEADGLWRIEGQLLDPRGVFPQPTAEDWVQMRWAEDPCGLEVSEAVARVDPRSAETAKRGDVSLTTEPLAIGESAAQRILQAGGVRLPNVTYRVFPRFGPHDDLYSLGMVFFLCILVNDSHDLGLLADDLGLLLIENRGRSGWSTRAREQVARNPEAWGPNAVLFDTVDRSGDRPNAIPDDLWYDILTLGLRMVAVAEDLTVDGESGVDLFDRVGAEVDAILRRLRALLFDRQPLNLQIQTVISELLAEE